MLCKACSSTPWCCTHQGVLAGCKPACLSTGALQEAYTGPVPFQRDGLMFLHKEGHYSLDSTPLALLWKDAHCSQYLLETEGDGTVPDQQVGSLPACGKVTHCACHVHVLSVRATSLCAPASTLPACLP